MRVIVNYDQNTSIGRIRRNHMPRQFSGLGDLARVCLIGGRRLSLGTSALWFQTESRPNATRHHPSSAEALETLYLIRTIVQKGHSRDWRKRDRPVNSPE
jgi:hypothetical protein